MPVLNYFKDKAIRVRKCNGYDCGKTIQPGEVCYIEHTNEGGYPRKYNYCIRCYYKIVLNYRNYFRNHVKAVRKLLKKFGGKK